MKARLSAIKNILESVPWSVHSAQKAGALGIKVQIVGLVTTFYDIVRESPKKTRKTRKKSDKNMYPCFWRVWYNKK